MADTFEPLSDCGEAEIAVQPAVVPVPSRPWATAFDQLIPTIKNPTAQLDRLAFGASVVQTPEYQAANLPAYNGTGGILRHFLL